jgi:hypothetical protein
VKILKDVLQDHQENDPEFGAFFKALHTFAERTIGTFFADTPQMPHPIISLDKVRSTCRGRYMPKDGMMLNDSITLDPFKIKDGVDAAEVLAHELVHVWQHHVGKLPERNYHNAEFHNRLGLMGIMSSGKRGHHSGYVEGGVWPDWISQNEDLQLGEFKLPGEEENRQLLKYQCPACHFSFRSRREDAVVVCNTEECDTEMELV